eukprot:114012_1
MLFDSFHVQLFILQSYRNCIFNKKIGKRLVLIGLKKVKKGTLYATPYKRFNQTQITKVGDCKNHRISEIDDCLVKIEDVKDFDQFHEDLNQYRFKNNVLNFLKNSKNVSMDVELKPKETKKQIYKKVQIEHDQTNNSIFQGLATLPKMNNSTVAWKNITSNTGLPITNAQQKRQRMKTKSKSSTIYFKESDNYDAYPYIIIHNKVELPKISDFTQATD